MKVSALRMGIVVISVLVSGCAATSHPDFQNVYRKVEVPQELVHVISKEFLSNRLTGAALTRDSVGRLRLTGSYENEDEVDQAFSIVHSVVGIKSTSPVFPDNVRVKRWVQEASAALERFFKSKRQGSSQELVGEKYAVVIGVSRFQDKRITSTEGAYDARLFEEALLRSGEYKRGNISVLVDEGASKSAIENLLRGYRLRLKREDSLVIFVSSHGKLIPAAGSSSELPVNKMRLVAHDSSAKDAISLLKSSVSDDEFIGFVGANLRQLTIILDTCDSGDAFASFHSFSPGGKMSEEFIRKVNGGNLDREGLSRTTLANRWLGAKDIVLSEEMLSAKDIIVDLGKKRSGVGHASHILPNGVILISASGPGEKSWNLNPKESVNIPLPSGKQMHRGSLFTVGFLDSLQLFSSQIDPSFVQTRRFVSQRVPMLEPGQTQTPHMLKSPNSRNRFFD